MSDMSDGLRQQQKAEIDARMREVFKPTDAPTPPGTPDAAFPPGFRFWQAEASVGEEPLSDSEWLALWDGREPEEQARDAEAESRFIRRLVERAIKAADEVRLRPGHDGSFVWEQIEMGAALAAALGAAPRGEPRRFVQNWEIAKAFHEAYERLAPDFGYETRKETAVPWDDLGHQMRGLMTATALEVRHLLDAPALSPSAVEAVLKAHQRWTPRYCLCGTEYEDADTYTDLSECHRAHVAAEVVKRQEAGHHE